jgi:hypothetical protein
MQILYLITIVADNWKTTLIQELKPTDFTGVASGKFQEQAPIFIKHAYAKQ